MPRVTTNIKIDGETCEVQFYERVKELRVESVAADGSGIYHPDLYRSLQAILGPVVGMAGLPKEWLDDGVECTCRGISIQRDEKDEIRSYVLRVTVRTPLQSVLNLAPKVMWAETPDELKELVRTVIHEAHGFLDGSKRDQTELKLDAKGRKAA